MFGWFRAKIECPVDPETRQWLEERLDWLCREFGNERLLSATVVLPTPDFFPDPYDGTPEDARMMLDRVCEYMGIQGKTIDLEFFQDRNPVSDGEYQHGAAGLYQENEGRFLVWVEMSNLGDPLGLVATLAHELGHVLLLGQGRIAREVDDHEPLTDLLTVFLGMGVFTANSVIRENYWQEGHLGGWSMQRRGYLTMPMYGYALALFARARGEPDPPWASELRPDVRQAFQQGERFLTQQETPDFENE